MSSSTSYHSVSSPPVEEWGNRELVYEGKQLFCYCGFKCPRWTAWIEGNAGRRFYACPNWFLNKKQGEQSNGEGKKKYCQFFEWHDKWYGKRAQEVIYGLSQEKKALINERDKLWKEITQLRGELCCSQAIEEPEFPELPETTLEMLQLKAAVHELSNKVSALQETLVETFQERLGRTVPPNSLFRQSLLAFVIGMLVAYSLKN